MTVVITWKIIIFAIIILIALIVCVYRMAFTKACDETIQYFKEERNEMVFNSLRNAGELKETIEMFDIKFNSCFVAEDGGVVVSALYDDKGVTHQGIEKLNNLFSEYSKKKIIFNSITVKLVPISTVSIMLRMQEQGINLETVEKDLSEEIERRR